MRTTLQLLRGAQRRFRQRFWPIRRRLSATVTLATEHGSLTVATADDTISRQLYLTGSYEWPHMLSVLQFLRSRGVLPARGRGTVLDIGANIGSTAIGLVARGEMARAVAVEPDPRNFALLTRNVDQNNLTGRILCRPLAVSDHIGTVDFELDGANFGDHRVRVATEAPALFGEKTRAVVERPCTTLAQLVADLPAAFRDDLALLWIDVQGHEAQVWRGAGDVLSRYPVAAEFWPYGLARGGVTPDEYAALLGRWWATFWVCRRAGWVAYPMAFLPYLFAEVGSDGAHENILLAGRPSPSP